MQFLKDGVKTVVSYLFNDLLSDLLSYLFQVFTSLSLFLMLISPLNAFPWVLNGLMEAWVSLKRVQQFVALTDLDMQQYYSSKAGNNWTFQEMHVPFGHNTRSQELNFNLDNWLNKNMSRSACLAHIVCKSEF